MFRYTTFMEVQYFLQITLNTLWGCNLMHAFISTISLKSETLTEVLKTYFETFPYFKRSHFSRTKFKKASEGGFILNLFSFKYK